VESTPCDARSVTTSPAPLAPVKDRVESLLSEHLDPRTAATAVRIASRTWLRAEPETLADEQLLGLTHGLSPLLAKLLGPELAQALIDRVLREATGR
jgi:hypothetical protein